MRRRSPFNLGFFPAGRTGVVSWVADNPAPSQPVAHVKLDLRHPCLDEWDNELQVFADGDEGGGEMVWSCFEAAEATPGCGSASHPRRRGRRTEAWAPMPILAGLEIQGWDGLAGVGAPAVVALPTRTTETAGPAAAPLSELATWQLQVALSAAAQDVGGPAPMAAVERVEAIGRVLRSRFGLGASVPGLSA